MNIEFNEEEIAKQLKARREKKMGLPPSSDKGTSTEEEKSVEHYLSPKVQTLIKQRLNVWLVGPAGSGKSKCAELMAQAAQLPFFCPPIGRETTNAQLFGYFNAQGNYVRTPIREACENGGVLHLEEIDFASPAVGTALNALLANDAVGFPDATIPKHPNFVVIASANTFGTGANASYIGSQGLNAATLDRFVFLEFPYDEKFERSLAPNKDWCIHVQQFRRKVSQLGLKHVVSPRATINGGHMANSKLFSFVEIEAMVLFKGLDKLTIQKINSTLITD